MAHAQAAVQHQHCCAELLLGAVGMRTVQTSVKPLANLSFRRADPILPAVFGNAEIEELPGIGVVD